MTFCYAGIDGHRMAYLLFKVLYQTIQWRSFRAWVHMLSRWPREGLSSPWKFFKGYTQFSFVKFEIMVIEIIVSWPAESILCQ